MCCTGSRSNEGEAERLSQGSHNGSLHKKGKGPALGGSGVVSKAEGIASAKVLGLRRLE